MSDIIYVDRLTSKKKIEKIYKGKALRLLYGDSFFSRMIRPWVLPFFVKWPLFSIFYGYLQKLPLSKRKIIPFIKKYEVEADEFAEPIENFSSFNDFFIRKLKPQVRPISEAPAVIPADGRYYFYSDIENADGFIVKGKKFLLKDLLGSVSLAAQYQEASMVIARLCPSDYHRFHFPCACTPGQTQLINGYLYSVNPLSVKRNLSLFTKNKRTLCTLDTPSFGPVLYLEIGATNVGSIRETYLPNQPQVKGGEKGYFEFGGSALILLFPKGSIEFDADLLAATAQGLEMRCLMGQSMGKCINLNFGFLS